VLLTTLFFFFFFFLFCFGNFILSSASASASASACQPCLLPFQTLRLVVCLRLAAALMQANSASFFGGAVAVKQRVWCPRGDQKM
jgi:hypothetical protein